MFWALLPYFMWIYRVIVKRLLCHSWAYFQGKSMMKYVITLNVVRVLLYYSSRNIKLSGISFWWCGVKSITAQIMLIKTECVSGGLRTFQTLRPRKLWKLRLWQASVFVLPEIINIIYSNQQCNFLFNLRNVQGHKKNLTRCRN